MIFKAAAKKVEYLGRKYERVPIIVDENGFSFEDVYIPISKDTNIVLKESLLTKYPRYAFIGFIIFSSLLVLIGLLAENSILLAFGLLFLVIIGYKFLEEGSEILEGIKPEYYLVVETPAPVKIRAEDDYTIKILYRKLTRVRDRKMKEE